MLLAARPLPVLGVLPLVALDSDTLRRSPGCLKFRITAGPLKGDMP